MIKYIKIGDVLVVLITILVTGILFSQNITNERNAVLIDTSEKRYRYMLDKNNLLEIEGTKGISTIEIKNEEIRFIDSVCPDKLCVRDGILKNVPVICIVNGVVIRYDKKNNEDESIDAIGY